MLDEQNSVTFWTHFDELRKLTLREGHYMTFSWGGPTEEGWHRETVTFTFEENCIKCELSTEGQDCDGRLDTHTTLLCSIENLNKIPSDDPNVKYPEWIKVKSSQRDYSAEAAGY